MFNTTELTLAQQLSKMSAWAGRTSGGSARHIDSYEDFVARAEGCGIA